MHLLNGRNCKVPPSITAKFYYLMGFFSILCLFVVVCSYLCCFCVACWLSDNGCFLFSGRNKHISILTKITKSFVECNPVFIWSGCIHGYHLTIHFPGSLDLPHQPLTKSHTKACSLGPLWCFITSTWSSPSFLPPPPFPQVTVEPCRAAAHLSAAPGLWSMTASLLTARGYSGHLRQEQSLKSAQKKWKTKRQIAARLRYAGGGIVLSPSALRRDHQSSFLSLGNVSDFDKFT